MSPPPQVEEIFKEGDLVDVAGTTIGKGFQGVSRFACCSTLCLLGWAALQRMCLDWAYIAARVPCSAAALQQAHVALPHLSGNKLATHVWNATGGIKRWGFARGNMTHGSKSKREHGSIGAATTPSRVFPGLKMPGQMGNKRTKIRKLQVRWGLGLGGTAGQSCSLGRAWGMGWPWRWGRRVLWQPPGVC